MSAEPQRYTALELLEQFPWVRWLDPQVMSTPDGTWLTCRICVAINGIRAQDVPDVGFVRLPEFEAHLRREHPELLS